MITLVGGLSDTLRPKCDMARVRDLLTQAVERLAPNCGAAGADAQSRPSGPGAGAVPAANMEALFAIIDDLSKGARRRGRRPVRGGLAGRPAPVGRGPAAP
ncbi:hypothetical protein LV779_24340 [Streptomyces thinghirensis]|nr:hypothetical protein [Streptomyces thinghirensis]